MQGLEDNAWGVGVERTVWFSHSEVTVAKSQSWHRACSPAPTEAGRGGQGHSHTHSVPQTSADEGPVTIFIICFYIHALRISPQGQHQTPALKGDLPSSRPEGHLGGHSHIYDIFSGTFPIPCPVIPHCLKACLRSRSGPPLLSGETLGSAKHSVP